MMELDLWAVLRKQLRSKLLEREQEDDNKRHKKHNDTCF